jgi:Ca-activated chloride channel family protein
MKMRKTHKAGGLIELMLAGAVLFVFFSGCARKGLEKTTMLPAYQNADSVVGEWASGTTRHGVIPGSRVADASVRNSSPVRDEEVWYIARSSASEPLDELPGSGGLVLKSDSQFIPLPLKHTDVKGRLDGYIATVDVTQQFHNPYDSKIEAVYVFPLPHDSAVNEFLMIIGERRIRGIIRERAEAEHLYQHARRQGYVASLMTQERPNIFTQSVANIEPGKQIDVKISYYHTLPYVDGWYEFVFPMVVGPRYNPPGTAKGIGSVPRGARGASGQNSEIEYLNPDERSGHDIALKVEVNTGVDIEELVCRTHVITRQVESPARSVVSLGPNDRIPNRDFVLRYRVAGDRIKSNLVAYKDERGGYFNLVLYPPKDLNSLRRKSMEMVFVLDCSGSMYGRPLQQAKTAIRRALHQLEPDDTFQIIRFSNKASQMGPLPVEASARNIERGVAYVESLKSEGGTEMISGIKAALEFPHDPDRLRFVCFLTDGYIGNEAEILAAVQERLGASRIFSFGVGPAINRYLLEHMAKLGRGAVAYLGPNDSASDVMDSFFNRISHPAMTDLQIDWGAEVSEVFPRRLPDLFVGRPVVLTGRFAGKAPGPVRLSGELGNQRQELRVAASSDRSNAPGIPSIWARLKIADLEDRSLLDSSSDIPERVRQLALDYGLLSTYTAYVAVDATRRTQGTSGTTVPVAVPVPEGVRYDTVVE